MTQSDVQCAVSDNAGMANDADLRFLVDEQAALRRVATLAAREAPPEELFGAVAAEAGRLLNRPLIGIVRYEPDATATVLAATGVHPFEPGTSWALDGPSILASIFRSGRPESIEYADLPGPVAELVRAAGIRSAVGVPIAVNGRTWGAVVALSSECESPPEGIEARLAYFTELVATAVANS